jgi:hypothetical protein
MILPYYSSLNYKMKKQLKEGLEQGKIDEAHAESLAIEHQADLNNISKAETMLKLANLKTLLQSQKELKKPKLSFEATNTPDLSVKPKEEKKLNYIKAEEKKAIERSKNNKIIKNKKDTVKELTEKINKNKAANIIQNKVKEKILKDYPSSSKATTADTSSTLGKEEVIREIKKLGFQTRKKRIRENLQKQGLWEKYKWNRNITEYGLNEIETKAAAEDYYVAEGLKKKNKKKK